MSHRSFRLCVLLAFGLAGFVFSAMAAMPPMAGSDLEQAQEQVRKIRASLQDRSAPAEAWGTLMVAETVLLRLRAQQAGTVDEAALLEAQREMTRRVFAEWKAARPDDAAPYLAEIQGSMAPERRDDAVLGLLSRFPDDPGLLRRALTLLAGREQAQRASALIEAALRRHPERSELYLVATGFYRDVGNETRQRELAETWIDRQPGNAAALRNWLGQLPPASDAGQAADRVERFVAAGGADPVRVDVCGWLLTADHGAYRNAAVRCLSAVSEQVEDLHLRGRAAALLAGAGGDEQELERSLGALPPERRQGAILEAVQALGEEQCDRKMGLLKLQPWDGSDAGGRPSAFFAALHGCETYPPARTAYLDALVSAPVEELVSLLGQWFFKVNGRYRDDHGMGPRIVAALEERLRRQSEKVEVWQALSAAYELAGWDERRGAHLGAWLGGELAPPNAQDLLWLGRYRAGHEGPQAGAALLRLAWRKTHDTSLASELADLLLETGKMDDFAALVTELAGGGAFLEASASSSSSSSPAAATSAEASLARLLRARAALLRRGPEAALAEYQAYVDHALILKPQEADEYLMVIAGVRGEPAAEQAAQVLCAKQYMSSGSTPTQCAANLLAELGHSQGALQLLEAAALRSPDDLRLQASLALAAERTGAFDRAEQAYRRMLAVDPKSEAAWLGLGHTAERRGDPAEIEGLLRQAERARGDAPVDLTLALARADLAHGRAARAIEVLKALRERLPGTLVGEDELRQAYEALAAAPSLLARDAAPASGSLSESSVAPPAPAAPSAAGDLRAEREAETALLGLGGTVDEAKGREIVRTLAQRGNLYANVRLAIWQHAGTQGFAANPRQATATVAPYLPALRAAAEGGEPFAQYLWGTVLLRGLSVPKQAVEAGAWLHKAAEQGEPWALHNLGWMAEQGEGVGRDLEAALGWYRRGAEAGNPFSMMSLATLRLEGEPAMRQPAEGVQWLARAAERGLPRAISWYAALLLYGLPGAPADPVRARPWLEKAAALGEVRGLYDLGRELLVGAGGPVDERRGVALLEKAAESGNARAMWQLVWQSALGRGTGRDGKRAEQWIERAAARGFDELGYILGSGKDDDEPARRSFARDLRELEKLAAAGDAFAGGLQARLYSVGIGVQEDAVRAAALARPAAKAGSTEAMRVLGWAYRKGEGVEADATQALAWWRRGAEGGNSFCMMWYSQLLFSGEGGTRDRTAALAWLERSGERGNAWAVRDLGHLYDESWHEVPRDENKAAYWKRKALDFEDQEARGWLIAHHLLD